MFIKTFLFKQRILLILLTAYFPLFPLDRHELFLNSLDIWVQQFVFIAVGPGEEEEWKW